MQVFFQNPEPVPSLKAAKQQSQNKKLFSDIVMGAFGCDNRGTQMHGSGRSFHCLKTTNLLNARYNNYP